MSIRTKVGQAGTIQLMQVSSGTSGTVAHTVDNFSNRLLVVCISTQDSNDPNLVVTGVTYGGVACTKAIATPGNPNDTNSEIWYQLDPAVGTANVVVSTVGIATKTIVVSSWSGVLQQAPAATVGAFANTGNASATLTVATPFSLVIDAASHKGAYSSIGSGQNLLTTLQNTNSFEHITATYEFANIAGSVTQTQSYGSSNSWSYSIAVFAPLSNVQQRQPATSPSRTVASTRTVASI